MQALLNFKKPDQGWAKDGTGESAIFCVGPDFPAGQSRDLRPIESRDRLGTERNSCPKMPGFVVPRDFSSGNVPQIFVPVPTVPWL